MNSNKFRKKWLQNLSLKFFAMNERDSLLPNLWFPYKWDLILIVLRRDDQHVSFIISLNLTIIGFSTVYALPITQLEGICGENLTPIILDIPWCFIGDFNAIIGDDEYHEAHFPTKIPMEGFHNFSDSNQFIHLPIKGNHFTWNNGRSGRFLTGKKTRHGGLQLQLD